MKYRKTTIGGGNGLVTYLARRGRWVSRMGNESFFFNRPLLFSRGFGRAHGGLVHTRFDRTDPTCEIRALNRKCVRYVR